jgi:hypothetical protein
VEKLVQKLTVENKVDCEDAGQIGGKNNEQKNYRMTFLLI